MPAAAHVRQTPPHSPLASDTPSDVPETSTCVRGASPYLRSASPNVRGGSPSSPSNAAVVDYAAAATNDVLAHAKPGETIATTKEEEWVTRKKSEVTTTRQIATRVKREVTLEDGRVLSDSGPKISTSTHEDTHTTNYHQSEHRALDPPSDEERGAGGTAIGADQVDGYHAASGTRVIQNGTAIGADGTAVATPVSTVVTSRVVANPEGKVRESHTKRQLTHHVTDHVREEQEEFHRGDTTHEAFITAVNETAEDDIREALNKRTSEQLALVPRGPRLVRETTAHSKTIDTEDTDELRALRPDGTILTETRRTTEHEHIQDEDLPADAAKSLSSNESIHRERSARERKACVETERATELMAGGRRLGTHVHSHTRTEEAEKEGDPNMEGPYDWDSLSMRMRRQRRLRHTEHDALKDSFAKRPIDFDIEEETRKKETSKWLENHFGSDSRSSHDSIAEEIGRKTDPGYFNVTIKSKPIADEGYYGKTNASTQPQPVFADRALRKTKSSTPSDERDITAKTGGYFKGVADWSQRRVEKPRMPEPRSVSPTLPVARSPYASTDRLNGASPKHVYSKRDSPQGGSSPPQGRRASRHPPSDSAYVSSSTVHSPPRGSPFHGESDRHREPSVEEDYRPPVAPERKRHSKPRLREDQRYDSGYRSSSRNETSGRSRDSEGASEPPPDYSPPPPRERRPSPEPSPQSRRRDERKQNQKTRFAAESARRRSPARKSVGAAIGNSIRKLVGKIRSASAERRARWRAAASRSPSPADHTSRTYQPYDDADLAPPPAPPAPPQRYYLGEDPFAGSIYGREHKYEGASPRRAANHDKRNGNDHRFSSTLGRFSHSTSRLNPNNEQEDYTRSAQTLPRKLQVKREKKDSTSSSDKRWHQLGPNKRSCSAVNVSIVNVAPTTNGKVTNGHHQGPAKPARTYKALNRSKSFAMGAPETEVQPRYVSGMNRNYSTMYKSNPHLSKLDETPEQLKSPGIVSIINRSQRDLADAVSREAERRRDGLFSTRYGKTPSYTNGNLNGRHDETDKKKLFMKGLKERAPELFQSLHGEDDSDGSRLSSRYNTPSPNYHNKDRISEERRIYKSDYSRDNSPYVTRFGSVEPVSRLRSPAPRRGSNSSDNYSETYRYSTKSGDPERPSVTDTVETVSKKVIPTRDGRGKEIIESREMNSVTTSRYKGEPLSNLKYVENGGRIPGFDRERISPSPLYSERRNSGYKVTEKVRDYRH